MPLLSLTFSNDTAIYPGTSVELVASASGGLGSYSYDWSTGQSGDTITVSPSIEQYCGVEVEDDNGCRMDDSDNVSISDLPDINVFGLDSAYCNDFGGFTFHATPDSGFYTPPSSWGTDVFVDSGDGEAYINPSNVSSEGTYEVVATSPVGCTNSMLNEVSTVEWQLPDDANSITGDDIMKVYGISYYSVNQTSAMA